MRSAGFSLSPRNELCVVAVHALSTWFMVGMIWTIQIVHYPLFAFVGSETYEDFQAKHVEVIGVLLVVPWLVEDYLLLFSWSACRAACEISGRWCSPYDFDHGSQRFRLRTCPW